MASSPHAAGTPAAPGTDPGMSGLAARDRALTDNIPFGIALMVVSVLVAPMIDVFSKLSAGYVPPAMVATARFVLQALFMLPFVVARGALGEISWRLTRFHVLRGGILAVAMVTFVMTLQVMAIADALAIFFIEPVILTILSGIFLREVIGWRKYLACGIGFAGALIVIQPSFREVGAVALLPVVTALGVAIFALMTRVLSHAEDPFAMQFQTGLWGAVFSALILFGASKVGFGTPMTVSIGWKAAAFMTGCAFFATLSGIIAVYAYRAAPASILAPLQYLEIVSATLFSWLVFGDFPDAIRWVGILVIIGSGLFIVVNERSNARKRGEPDPVP